ncbi:hypothetical protein LUCX_269 [Xanthomonas phage vB_XciM_LucasX]|nr:hypothetical protein LUCX_269 [Xanthomonas phage vB_XciM_LucasX]
MNDNLDEYRLQYIPLKWDAETDDFDEIKARSANQMVLIHEDVESEMCHRHLRYGSFGHVILLKGSFDRFRSAMDPQYVDASGTSRIYVDTLDQAIATAAQLRSLIKLSSGVTVNLVVVDAASTDLIGQLRELGYAPKESN